MDKSRLRLAGVLVGILSACTTPLGGYADDTPPAPGFAVVELFTSQGCSSCPPADAVLAGLSRNAAKDGQQVFALAFHVDYWDRLGWADPFGAAAYTDRQRLYARTLKLDSLYTPQMIVNGSKQFVGSNRATADREIKTALETKPAGRLTAKAFAEGKGYLVEITAESLPARTIVNIAVVEDGLSTAVPRGENAGQTLRHDHVVRWFRSESLSESGKLKIAVPSLESVKAANASVVVYAQQHDDLKVLAATAVALSVAPK